MIRLWFIGISISAILYIVIAPRVTIDRQTKIIDGLERSVVNMHITNRELNRTVDVKTFEANLSNLKETPKEIEYEEVNLSHGNHTIAI